MPSLPDNEQSCNPHLAGLVALNIVTQVLDEAEDILNTAHDSGQPWHYIWRQKKGNGECYENAKIHGILVDDNESNNCGIIQKDNVIVTSTPQKEIDYTPKTYNENSIIGQGDEDVQMRNTDLRSPSLLINCLFDMSDVEQARTIEVFDEDQDDLDSQDFLASNVAKLVESYVNLALNTVCGDVRTPKSQMHVENIEGDYGSSFSLLTDAFVSDDTEIENATYYIDNVKCEEDKEACITETINDEELKKVTKNDIDLYEKTFLTLNRDYDKYSEEEDFVIQDCKNFTMQEVELLTGKSCDDITPFPEPTNILTKTEEPPLAVEDHKDSLVKRCRLQGAKFMSRLRSWWWKQRLIGKRKGCRSGLCPLSPQARNLTASLLDHRKLRSPSPVRNSSWKFHTVNEALIQSYNMNAYELGINSEPMKKD